MFSNHSNEPCQLSKDHAMKSQFLLVHEI